MKIMIREYEQADLPAMIRIWNEVVNDGIAFPQEDELNEESANALFGAQSHVGVAVNEEGGIYGLYILHPNNIGRCGHIANASYAVSKESRGLRIGHKLVQDSMKQAKRLGFRILQFNAVVASNAAARRLYEKLGFLQLGTIRGGFRVKDGSYVDMCPYYIEL